MPATKWRCTKCGKRLPQMVLGLLLEDVVSLVFTIGLKTDLVALIGTVFRENN